MLFYFKIRQGSGGALQKKYSIRKESKLLRYVCARTDFTDFDRDHFLFRLSEIKCDKISDTPVRDNRGILQLSKSIVEYHLRQLAYARELEFSVPHHCVNEAKPSL